MRLKERLNYLDSKMAEIRKLRAELERADGEYKQNLQETLRDTLSVSDTFAMHDLIRAAYEHKKDEIALP